MNQTATNLFELGYVHALERGPKTNKDMKQVKALSESDYRDYLKGVKAGLDRIIDNSKK